MAGMHDHEDVVARLSVGSVAFWVSDESPLHANFSPETLGGGTVRMLLIVEDPDAAVERAVAAGATEISAVGDELAGAWDGSPILRAPLGHREAADRVASAGSSRSVACAPPSSTSASSTTWRCRGIKSEPVFAGEPLAAALPGSIPSRDSAAVRSVTGRLAAVVLTSLGGVTPPSSPGSADVRAGEFPSYRSELGL